jgi:hypothetical protein
MTRGLGVLLCLFLGLPLAGAGIFCAWVAGQEAWDAHSAREWVLVKADLVPGGWGNVPGEKRAGHFAYAFEGRRFEGRRLSVGSLGDDDIDAWRGEHAEAIEKAKAEGRSISLWVNPDQPARSAFYRDARWDHVILFGVIALGVGGAGRLALGAALSLAMGREDGENRPNGTTGAGFFWIFAILWNGFSLLAAFLVLPDVLADEEWAGLLVLLFPFVGILLWWAAAGATANAIKVAVSRSSGRRPAPIPKPKTRPSRKDKP